MRKFFIAASTLAALVSTAVSAQAQRYEGERRPEARRGPPPAAIVVKPAPPVIVHRPRRPVIAYAPPPPPPVWSRGAFPYAERHHKTCHQKAWRLRWFERRSAADGVLTYREQAEIRALRRDLRQTCGGWSWRG